MKITDQTKENENKTEEIQIDETEQQLFFFKLMKILNNENKQKKIDERSNCGSRRARSGEEDFDVECDSLSDFAELIQVLNYSEDETTKKKEVFFFNFLINIFSLQKFFGRMSEEIKECLEKYISIDADPNKNNTQDFLIAVKNNESYVFIERSKFRTFLRSLPNIIDECSDFFSSTNTIFHDLKTMIFCFNEEERLKQLMTELVQNKNKNYLDKAKKNDIVHDPEKPILKEDKDRNESSQSKKKRVKKNKGLALKDPNRYCSHCSTNNTSEWRKGPNGSRSLCNACGLFYSKLSKKFNHQIAAMIFEYKKKTDTVLNRMIPTGKSKSISSDLNFFFNDVNKSN